MQPWQCCPARFRPAPPTRHPSAVPIFPLPPGSYKVIATGQAVTIHPSSVLCGKKAECIVFNELVRLWYWSAPAAAERLCCCCGGSCCIRRAGQAPAEERSSSSHIQVSLLLLTRPPSPLPIAATGAHQQAVRPRCSGGRGGLAAGAGTSLLCAAACKRRAIAAGGWRQLRMQLHDPLSLHWAIFKCGLT